MWIGINRKLSQLVYVCWHTIAVEAISIHLSISGDSETQMSLIKFYHPV